MARVLDDVFRMRLRAGEFLPLDTEWTFRINDTGVQVAIERPADAIANSQLPPDQLARELAFLYVVGNCAVDIIQATSADEPKTYACELHVAKLNIDGDAVVGWFRFTLSPTHGITGTYGIQPNDGQGPNKMVGNTIPEIAWWRTDREATRMMLAPLTCGTYTLEGAIMDDAVDGIMVPVKAHLELLRGGQLVGKSEEYLDGTEPEISELTGSWTRYGIEMTKIDASDDGARSIFLYRGEVSEFKYTGHMANVKGGTAQDVELVMSQCFDMRLSKMQRHWSPMEHRYFPHKFREAVKTCLLSSLRGGNAALPGDVWVHVFEFCDSKWFA